MALDRQSIEKKDFPVGRRGYDPGAVDAHLSAVAQEVADLQRSARRRPSETLAQSASDRVRAIVEAAEASANEIQRDAESDAREMREAADHEAQVTRAQAAQQARQYVDKVSESTNHMMQRLDSIENELSALIDSLRSGAHRLNADLQLLETNLGEVGEVAAPRPSRDRQAQLEPAFPPDDEDPLKGIGSAEAVELEAVEPRPGAARANGAGTDAGTARPGASAPADLDDAEGARLIALNMALNGTPREETERYLSENFELAEPGRLLDEVYASVEG